MNSRQKGLAKVREVRKLLEANGHIVSGPHYSPKWNPFRKVIMAVHTDILGADLLSFKDGKLELHQVCSAKNKAAHEYITNTWVWTYKPRVKGFQRELIRKD